MCKFVSDKCYQLGRALKLSFFSVFVVSLSFFVFAMHRQMQIIPAVVTSVFTVDRVPTRRNAAPKSEAEGQGEALLLSCRHQVVPAGGCLVRRICRP